MTIQKQTEANDLHDVIKQTSCALDFRNNCMNIITRMYNLNVYSIYSPFWDVETQNNLGLTTGGVPSISDTCNDAGFATFTNLGDKILNKTGGKYYVYFSENKKHIRGRIYHDMIIQRELDSFITFIKHNNSLAIKANSAFINSLKSIPGNIFSFFKKHKAWRKLKDIPKQLLNIELMLPKYELFTQAVIVRVKQKTTYINRPTIDNLS